MYTTIRELVENSLDAAESIGVLPLVSLSVEEFTEAEFNEQRGMENRDVVDKGLFKVTTPRPDRLMAQLTALGREKNGFDSRDICSISIFLPSV